MSLFTQISLENVTQQSRLFFVLAQRVEPSDPLRVANTAWRRFDLNTGQKGFFAFSRTYQLTAQTTLGGTQHQTIRVETALGSKWTFTTEDAGLPYLQPSTGAVSQNQVYVTNKSSGSAAFSLWNDAGPLLQAKDVIPETNISFESARTLYFYASTPNPYPNLELESSVGELIVPTSGRAYVQLVTDGATVQWRYP